MNNLNKKSKLANNRDSRLITYGTCAVLMSLSLMCFEVLAGGLDQQLDKVSALTMGKIKIIGVSIDTIMGVIIAIVKSSWH
ncbi:MAG: hypothetical protein EOP33_05195 [Rickettsiaceae bacterium]|nr:MAG: hypothetical protein EOP33_05195 [Rickettsiaceae bacterium]